MTDRMPEPERTASDVGAEADAALDHALREAPVDESVEYDDQPATDEGEDDYVLYSEVLPHLEELAVLRKERTKLIDVLLYARDRVSSPAVASRMDDSLGQIGIQVIHPEPGDRFDAKQHEASATVPTTDKARHGTIAEIELAGYIDGDRVVRAPIVTVYSTEAQESQ
ncbi:GrpE protein [Antricoccus suffuscus]|uniref:GrpE protein n=1 Tax=Antricoccus suffuscus TaxID=1629062 RepID=A0A2T0ZZ56_9ACTN|nr:nucleotide exchange factor GrpE [Antricoccus suffuscus]PRZ41649.1 GrpE protein [Antricoccus suffuscus]